MTRAGQLRYRATIQKATVTQDTVGGPQISWSTHLVCWGELLGMAARWRETYIAQKETAEAHGVFAMRYQSGIDPTMRLYVDGRYLQIVMVLDPDGRKRDLHLMYREVQA